MGPKAGLDGRTISSPPGFFKQSLFTFILPNNFTECVTSMQQIMIVICSIMCHTLKEPLYIINTQDHISEDINLLS